jgi:hypothetical protein
MLTNPLLTNLFKLINIILFLSSESAYQGFKKIQIGILSLVFLCEALCGLSV